MGPGKIGGTPASPLAGGLPPLVDLYRLGSGTTQVNVLMLATNRWEDAAGVGAGSANVPWV
jgi:hypothetical protein